MAVRKKKHFSDQILDMILEQNNSNITPSESSGLTDTEREIVKLIADGFTTKEIAGKKHISTHTVMTHRKNIFRKLEVNSISELTKFAIRNGLTDIIEYNI
jgi:DNA-binding NarL/FixJ family response regulator